MDLLYIRAANGELWELLTDAQLCDRFSFGFLSRKPGLPVAVEIMTRAEYRYYAGTALDPPSKI